MKKHSLKEHYDDVWEWAAENWTAPLPEGELTKMLWWVAYERWLNDRELLTHEDRRE